MSKKILYQQKRKWKTRGALVRKTTAPTSRKTNIPNAPAGPCVVKKSQAFSRYLVQWNGLGPLRGYPRKLATGLWMGYNPLTNLSPSSWDIQQQCANLWGWTWLGHVWLTTLDDVFIYLWTWSNIAITNKYKKGGGEAEVCQKQWCVEWNLRHLYFVINKINICMLYHPRNWQNHRLKSAGW